MIVRRSIVFVFFIFYFIATANRLDAGAYLSSFSHHNNSSWNTLRTPHFNSLKYRLEDSFLKQEYDKDFFLLCRQPSFVRSKRIVLTTRDGLVRYGVLTLRHGAKGNVVLCHGAACDKEYMQPFVLDVFKDYNCLTFDFRRHGEACQGQYSTIGKKEIYEIEAAVALLLEEPACAKLPRFGFGISMGGAALIEAQSKNSSLFDGLIIQSTFESLHRQAQRTFPLYRLPLFNLLIYAEPSRFFARWQYGVHVFKLTPAKAIKSISIPIFLIHGTGDKVIRFDAFKKLKKAGKSIIKTWTPVTDKHTELYKDLPDEFIKHTNDFLTVVLSGMKK